MLTKRIIPCLDVKDNRVVKGVNFLNLRDAGDPIELGKKYSDEGADELVFLDITATIRSKKTTATLFKQALIDDQTLSAETIDAMENAIRSKLDRVEQSEALRQGYRLVERRVGPAPIRDVCFAAALLSSDEPSPIRLQEQLIELAKNEAGVTLSGGRTTRGTEMVHMRGSAH